MKFYITFIISFFLLTPPILSATETGITVKKFHITPKIYSAYRVFDYTAGITGVEAQVFSLGLGLTSTYKKFYSHIFTEKNLSPSEERTTNLVANTITFERKDSSVSIGYALNPSISVFTGYKVAETAITALDNSNLQGNFIRLNAKGFFVGAGAGLPFKNGLLSFSAAYALMRATFKQSNKINTRGNAVGASLSVQWQAPLTKQWFYQVGVFRHSYFYDKLDQTEGSINEHIVSIRASIGYRF